MGSDLRRTCCTKAEQMRKINNVETARIYKLFKKIINVNIIVIIHITNHIIMYLNCHIFITDSPYLNLKKVPWIYFYNYSWYYCEFYGAVFCKSVFVQNCGGWKLEYTEGNRQQAVLKPWNESTVLLYQEQIQIHLFHQLRRNLWSYCVRNPSVEFVTAVWKPLGYE